MIPLHEILFGTKQETLAGDHIHIDINTEKKKKTSLAKYKANTIMNL